MRNNNQAEAHVLTVAEVAEILKVSAKTVSRLVETGKLTAIRIGRLRRVTPAALEQFVKGQERAERSSALARTGARAVL